MTQRLVATAVAHWEEFDGYAVAHGMKPLQKLPLDRFCSFVYWMLTRNGDENAIAKFRADLWMPTPEAMSDPESVADERSPWNPANENKALAAFKAQLGASEG